MNYRLLTIILVAISISASYGNQNRPIIVSPFIDFSYDVGRKNWFGYPYAYGSHTRDGTNLGLGLNIYRKPIYLQLQVANYLNYLRNNGDVFGIVKLGMNEEVYKNGYFDMNFSYTDNLSQYIHYSAYSGSVGYYHLFMPIDTLSSSYFSFGINLGFVNHTYWFPYMLDPVPYPQHAYWTFHPINRTEMFTIAEFAWINKYLRPYIAFGLEHLTDNDYYSSPRSYGFFSIGIQAQLDNILPYFSGNQTKITYNKQSHYNYIIWEEPVNVRKPNIYLYPETIIKAKVTLTSQKGNYITLSIPPYNNCWEVTIEPSGKINNKYEYLFYEGKLTNYPKSKIGWSVAYSDLWNFFPMVMNQYGFNEKEIKDFVDYWQEYLPKSEFYDISPIINHEVENEFHLTVDPKPENVLRVWFYIKPTDHKNDLTSPLIPKFERKGFTVTEWGVLLK